MLGSIYLRKDGRYEGRITVGKNEDGKRIYHAFFGRTAEEVTQKMAVFTENQSTDTCSELTFRDIFLQWETSIQSRIKESTLANYRMKAEKHLLPEFGNVNIHNISPNSIRHFAQEKQDTHLSNRYITDILVLMKTILKFAFSKYCIRNPMNEVAMPKRIRSEVSLLSTKQQVKLERYLAEHHDLTTLGIALVKVTGLRIGELCALQWRDIDLKKRTLTVRKTIQRICCKNGERKTKLIITDPKSTSSCRVIPIPDAIIKFLREFEGKPDEYLLSGTDKPVEPRTMQNRFVRILKNVKLPSVHFHALRHMFASNCIRAGFDIKSLSEILGHSSVEITLNIYVHSTFEQKAKYMNRLKMRF